MKRVLILGADFTPSSLPPALRIRLLARHLPEFGWQPTILTTAPEFYESPVDPENEQLLPAQLQVVRTRALPAAVTRKFGLGDLGIRSLWHHRRALFKLAEEQAPDIVFIPVPPYVSMVLGRMLYDRQRVAYVIDYIDPWLMESYWKLPRAQRPPKWILAEALARLCEPYALRRVAHITGVSAGTTAYVTRRYPRLKGIATTTIPYGGELDDFDYIRAHPRANKIFAADGLRHISYIGAYVQPMEPVLRAVFDAVRQGLARSPELFERVRLHFVGTSYAPDPEGRYQVMPLAREMGVAEVVDEHPARLAYLDALQVMLDSHALLAPGLDKPHYTASKIFPYILSRRPFLAVFHRDSNVVSIVREAGAGSLVTFGPECPPAARTAEILAALEELLRLAPGYQPDVNWGAFEPYTARAMARRLADVLESCIK